MLLSRAGYRVALVDRATFPSDTMSTHFLWQRGGARLQAWGLLNRLEARGCVPIREITFDVGAVQMCGIGPAVGGVSNTYCPRRTVLDTVLVEAATESGAELVDGFVVDDMLWSEGRVVGVEGHFRGGATSMLRAPIVVGADGLHSTVARSTGANAYREHPALTGVLYSYWSGLSHLDARFCARPGQLILVWPTNDDLTCMYVAWPHQEFRQVRKGPQESFQAALALVPDLADAMATGQRESRFFGTDDLPNLYRTSAGPGWALAGDAGHHKDPSTGMGMSDAFASAELLADAIDRGLTGCGQIDDALATYQDDRDALTTNGFELTLSTARMAPLSPRLEAFYRAAATQPEEICRIFGVLGGSLPMGELSLG
jgi:2-polyprenyl-6-methoxyphenol hydroxylase-like FAD-dependent oxidoreductase